MPDITFLHPGSMKRISGGTFYDLNLLEQLNKLKSNLNISIVELEGDFPIFKQELYRDIVKQLESISSEYVIIDGLATAAILIEPFDFFETSTTILLYHNPLHLGDVFTKEIQDSLENLENQLLDKVDGIICTSQYSLNYISDRVTVPIIVAQPGKPVNVNRSNKYLIEKINNSIPFLLSVGSIDRRKNQMFILDAIEKIDEPIKFRIVGPIKDETYAKELELRINQINSNSPHDVKLEGPVQDVEEFYKLSDIFIHTPVRESYGMVIIEAMSYGLPVIVTNVDGISDTVGNAALLLETKSKPRELAQIILSLIRDEALFQEYRQKSLDHYKFVPTWTDTALKVYNFLISL